jgi:hypothetical protein
MKLQLEGQHLRFRVDEAEFARLLSGETVESATSLPGATVTLQVSSRSEGSPALSASTGRITLQLPIADLLAYQQRLPCRDGLAFVQQVDAGEPLQVAFEVDVRDSIRNRGPRRREPSA